MHPPIKYIHNSEAGITIGYTIDDAHQTIRYAVAYARKNKDRFNKAIGRAVVEGRLNKGGVSSKTGRERFSIISLDEVDNSTKYAIISPHLMNKALDAWDDHRHTL